MPNRLALRDTLSKIAAYVSQAAMTRRYIPIACLALCSIRAFSESKPRGPISRHIAVVMLSDLHFDPFHDPTKVPLLAEAPITKWNSILATPDSPDRVARFASIQERCKAKKGGTDTPYALLRSSLAAARAQSPKAGFVTLSGDLLVHDLDCRYRAAMSAPASTADDQSLSAAFSEKLTAFVIGQVEAAFPKIPVYVALGNNDSRCNHNRLDVHDEYLRASAAAIVTGLRGVSGAERALARTTYESAGYYAITMPAPMINTRLVVLDDIYMMPNFANCEANEDRKGEQEQIAWLQNELGSARLRHQRVWVLGHLPPSVNPDVSLKSPGSFCSKNRIVRFQDTDALANQISAHAGTITLGIFGHTHMDEFHLLAGDSGAVPVKVVASVSPVDGNLPSFTLGDVDLASATLADYSVYEASNRTGLGTSWSEEYDFDTTYREQGFTPVSLSDLISRFRTDKDGVGTESRAYQTHYLKGSDGKKLSPSWRGYVCSLDHSTADSFETCVCKSP